MAEQLNDTSSTNRYAERRYNLWLDSKHAVYHFGSDAARVYTAPIRLNKKSALILGGILAVGGVIYIYDQEIHDAFQRSKDDPLYKPIRKLGENFERFGYMGDSNKFLVGGLAFSYIIRWDMGVRICSDVLESHFIAGITKNIANKTFGRYRPFEGEGPRYFKFDGGTSLPSGHALNIIQTASIFSYHIDFWPFTVGAYTIAGAMCLERITSNAHWPSDVYFAAVYGYFVSKEILRLNENRRLRVTPTASNDRQSLGLLLSLSF
ncbi:MAG: phosphatase PAP2 family protein [Candidatus Zixiibacteriota bacterium]